jgi:hypothetical protein
MPQKPSVEQAVAAGLGYLGAVQLPDGSFQSFSSPSQTSFQPAVTYRTTFAPALILSALAGAKVAGSVALRERLAAWLAAQAGPQGSFNYWAAGSPQRRRQPYPDDLDDTFCALSALYLHDPALIDEKALASAVKLLLATESEVGGPYRTWLVPPDAEPVWHDVDLGVNSNVAYFLSLTGNPLPKLTAFIDKALTTNKLSSPYYPSAYPIVYFIARAYRGKRPAALIRIIRELLANAGNALETALCLSSLARLGVSGNQIRRINNLLGLQAADGSWPAAAFCLDPAIGKQAYYNGAPALTTAFAIEALQLYTGQSPTKRSKTTAQASETHQHKVLALARHQCRSLEADLRATTLKALRKLAASSNGPEIIGLPQKFNRSLAKPVSGRSGTLLASLSLANLYGWLAYTIYDDFLDETGQPALLPVANVTMRNSLACFNQARPDDPAFKQLVRQTFDTIDGANAWETAHCRLARDGEEITINELPNYGNLSKLAERSIGHALPALTLLLASGTSQRSVAFRQLRRALSHYLIARQLSDDCHDWPEDLANGHATYVVTRLLRDLDIKPGIHALPALLAEGRRQFWQATLPEICREMQRHINVSRRALDKVTTLQTDNALTGLLNGLETVINDTRTKQAQAESFLKHYRTQEV